MAPMIYNFSLTKGEPYEFPGKIAGPPLGDGIAPAIPERAG